MRSARGRGVDDLLQVGDSLIEPDQLGSRTSGPDLICGAQAAVDNLDVRTQVSDLLLERADAHPQRANEPSQSNNHHTQKAHGVTHPASLPPDLAALVMRDQFHEDQGDAAERDYRKGWNDHARHMLRLLAAREAL